MTAQKPLPEPVMSAAPGPHPDADLLRLAAEISANEAEADDDDSLQNAIDLPPGADREAAWDAIYAHTAEYHRLVDELYVLPARTAEGLRAKAELAWPKLQSPCLDVDGPNHDDRLVWSVVRDVLGETAEWRPAKLDRFVPATPAVSPDAELIAACERHVATYHALSAASDDIDNDHPLWTAYQTTLDAIDDTPAQTMDGLLAKARAAHVEALQPDGSYAPENGPADRWAWDITRDLLRLNGGAA